MAFSPSVSVALPLAPRAARPAGAARAAASGAGADGERVYLGIDFGTSGARCVGIDVRGRVVAERSATYPAGASGDAGAWRDTLRALLRGLDASQRAWVDGVAFDGTSASVVMCDRTTGAPLGAPRMYSEAMDASAVDAVKACAPAFHTTTASTSSLCKLVSFWADADDDARARAVLCHQADWLGWLLHGELGVSDDTNALKLGYDPAPEVRGFPAWMGGLCGGAWVNETLGATPPSTPRTPPREGGVLPRRVVPPGTVVGTCGAAAPLWRGEEDGPLLPATARVVAGTTDSIAAFVAADTSGGRPGFAVTSLGSTLALKMASDVRVDDARYGVYSHRIGGRWLVGGASNTGGAVLRHLGYDDAALARLSASIDPAVASAEANALYPLARPGERFPLADDALAPRLGDVRLDDPAYLHAVLEAIARVEAQGYALLQDLGASPLREVVSAGGGAANPAWTAIRARVLGTRVSKAAQAEAAYGAALLARQGCLGLDTYADGLDFP